MMRLWLLCMTLMLALAGCSDSSAPKGGDAPAGGSGGGSAPAAEKMTVGVVFDVGGKGDKSFNDSAARGLERAEKDFGIATQLFEPHDAADREAGLRRMAGNPNVSLIIGVGFLFTDSIKKMAKEYPNKKFACVDFTTTEGETLPDNLLALKFKEEDGSYLVGALAALLNKTGKVGFVGGMEIPLIKKFETGFRNGAKRIKPDIEVVVKYAGVTGEAFANPSKGKELALEMYDGGCDIIYHAAGSTGLGVFEAGRTKKKLAIGVDSDQHDEAPEVVLTSMTKNVDGAVYDTIKAVKDGTFKGGVLIAGLVHSGSTGENGVDYVYNEKNKPMIPDDIRAKVEAIRAEILAGKVNTMEGYAAK